MRCGGDKSATGAVQAVQGLRISFGSAFYGSVVPVVMYKQEVPTFSPPGGATPISVEVP